MMRVVLPVPVSPKIAMFLAASRRLRVTFEPRWSPAVWPSAASVPVASPIQRPKSPGSLRSGPTAGVASTSFRSGNVGSGLPSSTRTIGRKPNPPTMAAPASIGSPCESG